MLLICCMESKALRRCHYTGRLTSNGRVFDSSYERRRPLSFKVGAREVIQGWDKSILGDEDLPPMKVGHPATVSCSGQEINVCLQQGGHSAVACPQSLWACNC